MVEADVAGELDVTRANDTNEHSAVLLTQDVHGVVVGWTVVMCLARDGLSCLVARVGLLSCLVTRVGLLSCLLSRVGLL